MIKNFGVLNSLRAENVFQNVPEFKECNQSFSFPSSLQFSEVLVFNFGSNKWVDITFKRSDQANLLKPRDYSILGIG